MAVPTETEIYDALIYHVRQSAEQCRRMAMAQREDQYPMWMKIASNLDRTADHIIKLHGSRVAIALGKAN